MLFLQVLHGNLIYTSSILMGVYWLSVIGLFILAYYRAYLYKMAGPARPLQKTSPDHEPCLSSCWPPPFSLSII